MSTTIHIPLSEYLETSYRPDREYVDGELRERNVGKWEHARRMALLAGRAATADDYGKLTLAEQVFAEALRLYPPVWVTARTAQENYEYRGLTIHKGTIHVAPQYAVHRDPRWWPDPERFDPSRFTPAAKATRPKMAYFPFAAGSRQCIGEGLAWMEGVLVLATLVQNWRLSLAPGHEGPVQIKPAISLRPKGAMPLVVERRG